MVDLQLGSCTMGLTGAWGAGFRALGRGKGLYASSGSTLSVRVQLSIRTMYADIVQGFGEGSVYGGTEVRGALSPTTGREGGIQGR
ncbi:hypothetical protein FA13DRAFT_1456442 [Coprinellus micaceus]|uniref:Uncharacterized protein n=1 Tax=Coprinellus micaceus TaxID=71717 RepID=A0A4Y7SMT1_COPMI|nr:hypothetical protein FA13DRAFT_1456442 [Coprinellus micaceus]